MTRSALFSCVVLGSLTVASISNWERVLPWINRTVSTTFDRAFASDDLSVDHQVNRNCVAAGFQVANGVIHSQYFFIDTDTAQMNFGAKASAALAPPASPPGIGEANNSNRNVSRENGCVKFISGTAIGAEAVTLRL